MKYLLMFVFLIGSVSAHAVTDAHRNAAEELLQITGLKESLNRTAEQLVDFQIRQNPQMAPYRAVFLEFFKKYMSYDNLKNDIIQIYVEEFSENELKDIIRFYKTPTGRKTIEKLPVLMSKGAQVGMANVKSHMPELKARLEEEIKKQNPPKEQAH